MMAISLVQTNYLITIYYKTKIWAGSEGAGSTSSTESPFGKTWYKRLILSRGTNKLS